MTEPKTVVISPVEWAELLAEAWDKGYEAGVDDATMSADFRAEFGRSRNANPYRTTTPAPTANGES